MLLFNLLDLKLPWKRLKYWGAGVLFAIAFALPVVFRAGLLELAQARACSIEQVVFP
jgi:hypothetical protein